MQKTKTDFMELNHETAMRLWTKQFGKSTKVIDFTGREISKGAYNQRGSEYGWNVDHILPQSQGGKTADYNLICCHIKTNDEKADKFPCFIANEKKFEIIKVENHYEIKSVNFTTSENTLIENEINLYDSASGIRYFKKLKGVQNKSRFVGSILIRLNNVNNAALIDFIDYIFDEENISYSTNKNCLGFETILTIRNYNMPLKEDMSRLLDKCMLLNTYLGRYFKESNYIDSYEIYYRIDHYQEKQDMYVEIQKVNFVNIKNSKLDNSLFINELVYINTEAKEKEPNIAFNCEYQQYNYIFTKLSKNLKKEASN